MATEVDYKGFLKAFGEHVKALRKENGWSNYDIRRLHGINDAQWRNYERGGGLKLETLLRIAKVFDKSLVQLLDGLGSVPRETVAAVSAKKAASKRPSKKATAKTPAKKRAKTGPSNS